MRGLRDADRFEPGTEGCARSQPQAAAGGRPPAAADRRCLQMRRQRRADRPLRQESPLQSGGRQRKPSHRASEGQGREFGQDRFRNGEALECRGRDAARDQRSIPRAQRSADRQPQPVPHERSGRTLQADRAREAAPVSYRSRRAAGCRTTCRRPRTCSMEIDPPDAGRNRAEGACSRHAVRRPPAAGPR